MASAAIAVTPSSNDSVAAMNKLVGTRRVVVSPLGEFVGVNEDSVEPVAVRPPPAHSRELSQHFESDFLFEFAHRLGDEVVAVPVDDDAAEDFAACEFVFAMDEGEAVDLRGL